ncbi:Hachiman antiphage defense system protein HamA [Colwellia sp. Arc7-635]|uniref:Hachiman antiphage defense system protein HamA n=1 Tax=Colwellia sp. Arc7-635 TaxID=2497879 RepID=UPI002407F9FE|nr:Hachiman antiphage defense system protein HamA [Colwellia sp. Arc7-635]
MWRVNALVDCAREWLIDYALSASVKKSLENKSHSQMAIAFKAFQTTEIDVMNDLFLHMAIRQNYKTIPIVNKVINTQLGSALSCSHIVLEKGKIEIWLGASSIQENLKDATTQAIKNIEVLLSVETIQERLILITEKMDDSWPFKDKLEKLSDNTIPMAQRFDKIVVPIFITHDSDTITKYDEGTYIDELQKEIDECRLIITSNFSSDIIQLVNLKVFIFPVKSISDLHSRFKEGISL